MSKLLLSAAGMALLLLGVYPALGGAPKIVELFMGNGQGYWRVPIIEIPGGFRINRTCAEEGGCEALKALHRAHHDFKDSPREMSGGYQVSPKSIRCMQVGGQSAILRDAENNQYDFCRFSDGSMIESVDLVTR